MQPVYINRGAWKGRLGPHPVPEHGGKMFLRIIGTNLRTRLYGVKTQKKMILKSAEAIQVFELCILMFKINVGNKDFVHPWVRTV
jgi:hypothetical protein